MPKFGILLGVTGSGKTHNVTARLRSSPQMLTVDAIRSAAIDKLCTRAEFKQYDKYRWPIWDLLLARPGVTDAIQAGIVHSCREFAPSRDTFAEGELLANRAFRDAFLAALKQLGFQPNVIKVFWLDPSPTDVLANIRVRGRLNQANYSLDDAQKSVAWYQGCVGLIDCDRIADATAMVYKIDEFYMY